MFNMVIYAIRILKNIISLSDKNYVRIKMLTNNVCFMNKRKNYNRNNKSVIFNI